MKNVVMVLAILCALGCSCSKPSASAPPPGSTVSIGMNFDLAKQVLSSSGAKETALSMMYTPEFTTYELADGCILCITADGPLESTKSKSIVKLTICRDPSVRKDKMVFEAVEEIDVKEKNS